MPLMIQKRPPLTLPLGGQWLPDQQDYQNPGVVDARNVIPDTPDSYGPYPQPVNYSGALTARCQGAAGFAGSDGTITLFAGDANDLYSFGTGSLNWTKVSQTPGGYGIAGDAQWNWEYFKGLVIATDYADNIQAWTLGTSTAFADLAAGAPKAKYIATIRNFLMAQYTNDPTGGVQPQRMWWSGFGDATNWPTPGSVQAIAAQSSYNDITGKHGTGQGLIGNLGNADGLAFFEHAVFRILYAGPGPTWDFPPAENFRGCIAPGSIVQVGAVGYYWGEDGIYSTDGATSTPIGAQRVDKTVFRDLDRTYLGRVVGTVDPTNKLVLWAYPGAGNVNGNPNHILTYRWDIDRFSILDVTVETIARLLGIGYTLDQLYSILGYTFQTLPASFDSPLWKGGAPILVSFDASHQANIFSTDNPSLAATVTSAEIQVFPGLRTEIINSRPIVDGDDQVAISIGKRERLVDPVIYKAAVAMNSLGECPVPTSGRYIRAKLTLPAGSSFKNIREAQLDVLPAGEQ